MGVEEKLLKALERAELREFLIPMHIVCHFLLAILLFIGLMVKKGKEAQIMAQMTIM